MNPKESFVAKNLTQVNERTRDAVLKGLASNVKMGPFTATSGVSLPCKISLHIATK